MPNLSIFDYHFFRIRAKIIKFVLIIYYKIKNYFYFGNFRKKHITYGFVNGKFQITSIDHEDFVEAIRRKINAHAKNNNRKEFIRLALTEALEGCNFIIFFPKGESNKFIQFWTGDHALKCDFYANKVNKLKNFFLPIVGLLSEMGFVNNEIPDYRGFKVYKVDKGSNYISVSANFKNDLDFAVEFTELLYKQIYKAKSNKLIAKVE